MNSSSAIQGDNCRWSAAADLGGPARRRRGNDESFFPHFQRFLAAEATGIHVTGPVVGTPPSPKGLWDTAAAWGPAPHRDTRLHGTTTRSFVMWSHATAERLLLLLPLLLDIRPRLLSSTPGYVLLPPQGWGRV